MKYLFSLLAFISVSTIALSQTYSNAVIQLENNTTTQGRAYIDNSTKKVIVKTNASENTYPFSQVSSVTLKGTTYVKTSLNGTSYLASEKVNGKARLFSLGSGDFAITNDNAVQIFNTEKDQAQLRGILSVLFNDCNSIRESLNKETLFKERTLTNYINQYNNCSYESGYSPSKNEVEKASRYNTDKARFYAGLGAGFTSTSFFDNSSTEATTGFGINAGVAVTPSFTGSLQGNLYFYLEGSALFTGDNDFSNNTGAVNFSRNTFSVVAGAQYVFNKTGKLQPFLGIGVGGISDSFDGSALGNAFDISGGNVIYVPKAGVLFQLNNGKHLGLSASYIPEYENDLSFPVGDQVVDLVVNTSSLNVGLFYIF